MSMSKEDQPRYMTPCEKRLARGWIQEEGLAVEEVARRLSRNRSSIWDLLADEFDERPGVGRKPSLTEGDKDRLVALTDKLVKEADVRWLVTAELIQKKFAPKVCIRTLQKALHERDVWFFRLREKPILTDEDVEERYIWAKLYRRRSKAWWLAHVHLHIDNHAFKVPANKTSRRRLAAKRVHGTYRTPGKSLEKQHVKASSKMRINTGARSVLVAGGLGSGKALLWHVVEEQWCGDEAVAMYAGPLQACLAKEYAGEASWRVLEDNDPSGYQSTVAKEAKRTHKIKQFAIPKRSPDLNVLDFYFWSNVEKKLRQ